MCSGWPLKMKFRLRKNWILKSVVAVQNLEPLRTQAFQINYGKASDIAAGLGGCRVLVQVKVLHPSRILSSRGSVIYENRTNQLFVTDIPSKLEQVQQLIAKIDIAVRQVLIEARIVEASDSFGKSLGVKLGGGGRATAVDDRAGIAIGSSYVVGSAATTSGNFVNLPSTGALGSSSPGTFAVSIFGAGC